MLRKELDERLDTAGAGLEKADIVPAWPSARVRRASTTKPLRFYIKAWPLNHSFAS